MNKCIDMNIKFSICKEVSKGRKISNLANKYNVSISSIYRWINLFRKDFVDNAFSANSRNNYYMRHEFNAFKLKEAILSKTACTPYSCIKDKCASIKLLSCDYSTHLLCETFHLRRSTYYQSLKSADVHKVEVEDNGFKEIIIEEFELSKSRYGCEKIRTKLQRRGITISAKRVSRLMKELDIQPIYGKKPYSIKRARQHRHNLLNQNFIQPKPNLVWVSDVTYIKVFNDFYYLCVIIDLFNREVISYEISDKNNIELTMSSFTSAYEKRKPLGNLMFHSDRGANYISYQFKMLLKKHNTTQSLSRAGYPYDNSIAENFFNVFKKEEACL